jgi:hypothetical protein
MILLRYQAVFGVPNCLSILLKYLPKLNPIKGLLLTSYGVTCHETEAVKNGRMQCWAFSRTHSVRWLSSKNQAPGAASPSGVFLVEIEVHVKSSRLLESNISGSYPCRIFRSHQLTAFFPLRQAISCIAVPSSHSLDPSTRC